MADFGIPNIVIDLEIATQDFEKAYKEFDKYEQCINVGFVKGVKRFEELAQIKLGEILRDEKIPELRQGIRTESGDYGVKISVEMYDPNGDEYAEFLEYGVGIVGMGSHPNPPAGWEWNVGTKIKNDKWLFPIHSGDPYPVVAIIQGNPYSVTSGYAGKQFMLQLWKWARSSFTNIIKGAIRRELKAQFGKVG